MYNDEDAGREHVEVVYRALKKLAKISECSKSDNLGNFEYWPTVNSQFAHNKCMNVQQICQAHLDIEQNMIKFSKETLSCTINTINNEIYGRVVTLMSAHNSLTTV